MITAIIILIPFIAGILAWVLGDKIARLLAIFASIVTFGLTVFSYLKFQNNETEQLTFFFPWVKTLGINIHLGMDGVSILLVLLTALLFPIILISVKGTSYSNPALFYALALIMESALIGVFTAYDAFLFYVFWELALIPIYFICLLFGADGRLRITLKFFVYTLAGSLLMLIGIIYLRSLNPDHNFEISSFYKIQLSSIQQTWLFWSFFIAFAIKMPIFPFHTWQPDTYTNAPAQGTMMLGGIMSKMGVYGLIRFILPMFPEPISEYGNWIIGFAIFGIVYGSLLAWVQTDFKRLIAYSSFAHMGIIAAGVLSNNQQGFDGAMLQMIAHGINAVGLFLIVDYIENTSGTRDLSALGGIRSQAPKLATVFLLILLGSVGLPLTNGFVGEFLLLSGIFQFKAIAALFAGLTMILGAVYMLFVYQRTMLGESGLSATKFKDIDGSEYLLLLFISIFVILGGVFPNIITNICSPVFQILLH